LAEDAKCAICLCYYEEKDRIRDLPCAHHFHLICVDQWLKQRKHCPLCQRDIDKVEKILVNLSRPRTFSHQSSQSSQSSPQSSQSSRSSQSSQSSQSPQSPQSLQSNYSDASSTNSKCIPSQSLPSSAKDACPKSSSIEVTKLEDSVSIEDSVPVEIEIFPLVPF